MLEYVVGIDPDAERHGFALYDHGHLAVLDTLPLVEIVRDYPSLAARGRVVFSVEHVASNGFVYSRNRHSSTSAQSKIAMGIGRCQQAQLELLRWLDHLGAEYVLYKPQAGNWADVPRLFAQHTGWTGRSNADTRAAAFFGHLALCDYKRGTLKTNKTGVAA